MPEPDSYLTLAGPAEVELPKIKGSRFIGVARPAGSIEEAKEAVEAVRKQFYDARHHCFAYRLAPAGDVFRAADDGEPAGSAGQPILAQLAEVDLVDAVAVVVRYFGGTKLGVGGLVRAYGAAAKAVLESAVVEEVVLRTSLAIQFAYDDTSPAMRLLDQFDVSVIDTVYGSDTTLHLAVRNSQVDAFSRHFVEQLAGRGTIRLEP